MKAQIKRKLEKSISQLRDEFSNINLAVECDSIKEADKLAKITGKRHYVIFDESKMDWSRLIYNGPYKRLFPKQYDYLTLIKKCFVITDFEGAKVYLTIVEVDENIYTIKHITGTKQEVRDDPFYKFYQDKLEKLLQNG